MNRLIVRKKTGASAEEMWEAVSKKERFGLRALSDEIADEIAGWVEGGGVGVGLPGISVPLHSAKACLSVRHAGEGSSEVAVTVNYHPGWGLLGALLDAAALRPAMRRALKGVIEEAAFSTPLAAAPARLAAGPARKREREGILTEAKMVLVA
jgi:hypothetical protein